MISNIRYNKCYQCYNKKKFKESQIQSTSNITEYYSSNKESTIQNPGYIDPEKHGSNIRIFSINPRGFGPDKYEKIVMLKQSK